MMLENIVISDANIIFDLISIGLFDRFCSLPTNIITSDFVYYEIQTEDEKKALDLAISEGVISVESFTFDELVMIKDMNAVKGSFSLSIPDCSVWYLAKKTQGRLLTGDRKLRSIAEKDGVSVSGILFVFDCLLNNKLLSPKGAIEKLRNLLRLNPRLPVEECEKRIRKWTLQKADWNQ